MLIKEQQTTNIIRYYSDRNKYIRRIEDGTLFRDRLDTIDGHWTYEETEFDIETTTSDSEEK